MIIIHIHHRDRRHPPPPPHHHPANLMAPNIDLIQTIKLCAMYL